MPKQDSITKDSAETVSFLNWEKRWLRVFRIAVLLLFAALTLYGIYQMSRHNWQEITAFWFFRYRLLLLLFLFATLDIAMDAVVWNGILRQQGVRLRLGRGLLLFLSGYAGLFMPVQMGRFFRATELSRIYGVSLAVATKTEITLLLFVAISSVSVFFGSFFWTIQPSIALVLPFLLTAAALFILSSAVHFIPFLSKQLPHAYLRRPATFMLCSLTGIGWFLNGFILFLICREITTTLLLSHTIMIVTSNLFVGIISGLPGGVGITESYIGGLMYWLSAPPEHLVLAIGVFRILTFWIWIPIGWLALLMNHLLFGIAKDKIKPKGEAIGRTS